MLGMEDCGPARGAGRWLVTMGPPRVGLRKTAGARPGLCCAGTRTGAGPGAAYSGQQDDTTYDIYLHDERTLDMGTNLENAFVNNAKRRQNDRRDFDSFSCETPPGYEESLYRQRILKLHNR